MLTRDCEIHSIDHAGEPHKRAIAGEFDDPPAMGGGPGLDDFTALGLELGEGAGLVFGHKPAVANHVGGQNCRKPPLDAVPCHRRAPYFAKIVAGSLWSLDWQV